MPSSYWNNIFDKNGRHKPDLDSILKKVPFFSQLKKSELREFKRILHHRHYKKGEVLFFEDEPGVGMYVIETGKIGIYKNYDDASREELAILHSGEFLGEMALLDESPRSATAVALENSSVFGLFRPDLFNLIESKPRLGNKILLKLAQMLAERLRLSNNELQELKQQYESSVIIR
ncbi:MAG: cyclic nucleotide-binding domain-containing protein [candidate division KSB1 bacterium]|nr:cyclic nucleotide-binding domain-containing protein [candidate division KSB1 bacterium]MDZ7334240.1 cyclic nucleotide-binding domain-containing protein [candidate division KSB1 bacterium]MDZ7356362.1 cyclic nucleotide-binding domain-containing protein [candidate division KSB1 bacterium]MDZ7376085.1 cyclic nucleotide-binding domain-containing protein [candidate division KSB1 bacterium]MDZ7401054.1 cyclic nucleotide-binding domain-containing protein [candidate division KSB1 bacterium]